MEQALTRITTLLMFVWLLSLVIAAHAQEIVTLPTRSSVTQSFLIASLPQNPQAVAVLFPGSGGLIRLRQEKGEIKFGPNNFLVRSRGEFVKLGVVAVIVDAPSDYQSGGGMSDDFRLGADHFTDISAVVADIGKRFPSLPIFLIGTSRGTISAAALGARFGSQLAGVVLTSTVFRQSSGRVGESGRGLSRFDFGTIKTPVLFVHHVSDQCGASRPTVMRLGLPTSIRSSRFGGRPPESGPKGDFSAHGYLGKRVRTVEANSELMLKKPFIEEVR